MEPLIDILLVDDEERNLDALEAILDDPAYRLLRATDADHALRLLLEHEVAAIVLDIKMPLVSGFELAQMIKGVKKFREIPIVFLTAHMMEDQDVVAGYGAGAVDYLTKPVKPQILRHKVAVFADLFQKTRALAELNDTLEARVSERTAELERSEAALRAAASQKDEFLATLAHELRNPLAPIRTGLQVMQRSPSDTATALKIQAMMDRQLRHMVRLVDDLLDVSRISRGKVELKRERVAIQSVIEHALESSQPFIDAGGQVLSVSLPADSAWVDGDLTRLAQIVSNLVNNAAKFTPRAGSIDVVVDMVGPNVVVSVTDTGTGVAPEMLPKVFDLFAQVDSTLDRAQGGLGIGLSLAKKLAELHGGALHAESGGLGCGSTFTLSLPVAQSGEVWAQIAAPENATAVPLASRKILVVDDNIDGAEMLATLLELSGHHALIAHDGEAALRIAQETPPDLIFLDLGMPGMNGYTIAEQLKSDLRTARSILVALTGWGSAEDRRKTAEAGFSYHLTKPVDDGDVQEVLQKFLGHKTPPPADAQKQTA